MLNRRATGPLFAVLLAGSFAFADDEPAPKGGAAATAAGSTSASTDAPAASVTAPPNAPIVLDPGVAPTTTTARPLKAPEHAPPHVQRTWFGYQTLLADIAIAGTTAILLRSTDEKNHLVIFLGGSALFLSAAPLIHLANGSEHTGSSFLVHAIALGGGALFGALLIEGIAGCHPDTPCKLQTVDFAAMGAGLGAMVATVVDAGWLAWKTTPTTTAYVKPSLAVNRGGATINLNVVF